MGSDCRPGPLVSISKIGHVYQVHHNRQPLPFCSVSSSATPWSVPEEPKHLQCSEIVTLTFLSALHILFLLPGMSLLSFQTNFQGKFRYHLPWELFDTYNLCVTYCTKLSMYMSVSCIPQYKDLIAFNRLYCHYLSTWLSLPIYTLFLEDRDFIFISVLQSLVQYSIIEHVDQE